MSAAVYQDYHDYLAQHVVGPFYQKRLEGLKSLRLANILKKKNPYLFKAKNIEFPQDLVRSIVDAFLSSQEETMFGNLLEGFAVYVSAQLYGGFKSALPSVDLEFKRGGKYYIVGIKSSTNWGNADQLRAMKANFKAARERLRVQAIAEEVVAVNGCMYGKDRNPLKANDDPDKVYYKYAGQDFWQFISGDDQLYREIIKPIDAEARVKDEVFRKAYTAKVNEMTRDFMAEFMRENEIDWLKLVDYVSLRG